MNDKKFFLVLAGWIAGLTFTVIGLINTFWGNDTIFGLFIVALSLIFYPPVTAFVKRLTGFSIPLAVKIILGLFILWAALGVGELFDKTGMMIADIQGFLNL